MSQRLLHKRLFLWAAARILIPPGSLPPIVGDCGKPAALLGSADVQVGDSLAIYIHDPCAYLGIGRFVRLPSGLCIVVINLDRRYKQGRQALVRSYRCSHTYQMVEARGVEPLSESLSI